MSSLPEIKSVKHWQVCASGECPSQHTPAGGGADVDEDVVALIRGHNSSFAGLLVQLERAIHGPQLLAGHQQAAVRHRCWCHALLLHLLKHLRMDGFMSCCYFRCQQFLKILHAVPAKRGEVRLQTSYR